MFSPVSFNNALPMANCCNPQISSPFHQKSHIQPNNLNTTRFQGCPLCLAAAATAVVSTSTGGVGMFLAVDKFFNWLGLNPPKAGENRPPSIVTQGIRKLAEKLGYYQDFPTTKP